MNWRGLAFVLATPIAATSGIAVKLFEKNTAVVLAKTLDTPPVSFEVGAPVDHLQIFNQFHQVGTWELDVVKNHVFWSAETYEIHGMEPDTGPVDPAMALRHYHPEDAKKITDALKASIKLKSGFQCKLRIKRRDGAVRMTESVAAPVLDGRGAVVRLVGTFRDITSMVRHENTRLGQQHILQSLITTMPISAALFDMEMRYVAWSPRVLVEANLPDGTDLKTKSHFDVFPEIAEKMRHLFDLALRGSLLTQDNDRMELPSGKVLIQDWRMIPWSGPGGNVTGLMLLSTTKYTGTLPGEGGEAPAKEHDLMSEFSKVISR
jgi:PAS domain S-box-containing protein